MMTQTATVSRAEIQEQTELADSSMKSEEIADKKEELVDRRRRAG